MTGFIYKKMKTLNRSFGFTFRDELFQGTLLQDPSNGRIDIYCFYKNEEFACMNDFHAKHSPNQDEVQYLNAKINDFINKK